eukprot:gene17269-biopygen11065
MTSAITMPMVVAVRCVRPRPYTCRRDRWHAPVGRFVPPIMRQACIVPLRSNRGPSRCAQLHCRSYGMTTPESSQTRGMMRNASAVQHCTARRSATQSGGCGHTPRARRAQKIDGRCQRVGRRWHRRSSPRNGVGRQANRLDKPPAVISVEAEEGAAAPDLRQKRIIRSPSWHNSSLTFYTAGETHDRDDGPVTLMVNLLSKWIKYQWLQSILEKAGGQYVTTPPQAAFGAQRDCVMWESQDPTRAFHWKVDSVPGTERNSMVRRKHTTHRTLLAPARVPSPPTRKHRTSIANRRMWDGDASQPAGGGGVER